jgi:hypothetical protein
MIGVPLVELILGTVAEILGFEPPSNFEFAEIRRVDLIQRRVAIVA